MFSHQGLFLAVVIPLASIALADVLVQPLPNKELTQSTRYLSGVQRVYPYESFQTNAPSHVVSYSHRPPYHYYHYLPRPHHVHYARIGHGYVRPSVNIGYFQPLAVHTQSKRSRRSDPTRTESDKSEIPAHDNDVATKSPLTDAKQPTTVDSLLPEREPTDTNDKRVESRQIGDYVTRSPLFGLYPKSMHLGRSSDNPNRWQHVIRQSNSNQPSTEQDEMCCDDSRLISNRPYGRFDPSSQESQESDDDDYYRSKYRDASLQEITNMNMISMAKPSQDKTLHIPFYFEKTPKAHQYAQPSDTAVATASVQPQQPFVTYVQNGYRNNEELSGTDEIVGSSYIDRTSRPSPNYYSYYSYNYPSYYSNYDSRNVDFYINLNKKNSNSADGLIKPPIKVPYFVHYTNIKARHSFGKNPDWEFSDWPVVIDEIPVSRNQTRIRPYPEEYYHQTSNPPISGTSVSPEILFHVSRIYYSRLSHRKPSSSIS